MSSCHMDDTFDALDHAAVAGAEGTAWAVADLSTVFPAFGGAFDAFGSSEGCDSHTPTRQDDPTSACAIQSSSFVPSVPIPIPPIIPKHEPSDTVMPTIPSSPSQPSHSSLDSIRSSARSLHATPSLSCPLETNVSTLSSSPTSIASLPKPELHEKKPFGTGVSSCMAMESNLVTSPTTAASVFSSMDLQDLTGTTAARSRKMTEEERRIMLHKRRLRNRASAARSREKRSKTLVDLTVEVEDLIHTSFLLVRQASHAAELARKLHAKNILLSKENQLLRAERNL